MEKRLIHTLIKMTSLTLTAVLTSGCGVGPYGFSRYYVPTNEENPFFKQTGDYPYGVVTANPSEFEGQLISWFGVVQSIQETADGRHLVNMTHNRHKDRHLCADERNSSCRVTVHFKSSGGFSAILALHSSDLVPGLDKIQPGSLLKVYGRVRCRLDVNQEKICDYNEKGEIILEGAYYRHWPARYYVTTRRATSLRR